VIKGYQCTSVLSLVACLLLKRRVYRACTYKDLGLVAIVPFAVPRTEKIRKVLLELDDSAETVEPERVKCKTCEQWVPLEKKYSVRAWSRHKGACRNNLKYVLFNIHCTLNCF
jgi:hypothetical protein